MKLKKIDVVILLFLLAGVVTFCYKKYFTNRRHDLSKNKTSIKWIEGDSMRLGNLLINKSHNFSTKFINSGDSILLVQNIKPTCGCTEVNFSSLRLKPKDTCTINGTIKPNFIGANFTTINFDANTENINNKLTIVYTGN